ncbi:lipopolysaccharide biosynthesis protein [Desulfovibrio ferrophilus]|uniref:ABC transporter, permease protein n=1 Tax=Desulfovibrio ferrophilus TaxID=241368 RepID=A0A2Z6B1C1_9BACT|nr:oligosaccharide flippase family protein [Desulfovibrio ferrophilus]BBD09265.1 ABC transporter, permease protein [Desulfovibrio ferrophilus]
MTGSRSQPAEIGGYGRRSVRNAGYHFLMGKALAFVAGLLATLLAARWMSVPDFGAYMLVGGISLLLGIASSLGLREVVQRFVPELVAQGLSRCAGRLVFRLLAVRALGLAMAVALLYLSAPQVSIFFDMPGRVAGIRAACPALAAMTLFSFAALLLETLLQQKHTKWLWLLAALLRLGLMLAVAGMGAELTLGTMLAVDALAFGLVFVGALWLLVRWTMREQNGTGAFPEGRLFLNRVLSFGAYNYLMVLSLGLQGGAVNKIVAAKYLPVVALAGFAFAQTLADTVQRNLPNMLLINLARPALMASYSRSRDPLALAASSTLFFKINLFVLVPILAWVAACGEPLVTLLSGGKYTSVGPLFGGLLVLVGLGCHYRRLEFICHALEWTRLLFLANLAVVAAVIPAALLASHMGPWGIVLALIGGCVLRDVMLSLALARQGVACGNDWGGLLKLGGCGLGAWLGAWLVSPAGGGLVGAGLGAMASGLVFLGMARLVRPFSRSERVVVNGFLPKPVFVW